MTPSAISSVGTLADSILRGHTEVAKKALHAKTNSLGNGDMGPAPLLDLYSGNAESLSSSSADETLRRDIIAGLCSTKLVIPGQGPTDQDFAYRKTLPTTILYDEQGLLLYDKLTTAPEYYLYNAELQILRDHGAEIARRIFGYTTSANKSSEQQEQQETTQYAETDKPQQEREAPKKERHARHESLKQADKERWGDNKVGEYNGGVNAEEGLDGVTTGGAHSLVELGAGSLKKTIHLLKALKGLPSFSKAGPSVNYFALDLDKAELLRTLRDLHAQEALQQDSDQWTIHDGKVGIHGMWATYDAGLDYIGGGGLHQFSTKSGAHKEGKRCLLWLGSSIGNFDRKAASEFLARTADGSMRAGDTMLISIDRRNKPADVALAYNDPAGLTRDFIMNGLDHIDRVLGGNVLDRSKFEYHDRYNSREGRHESYYRAKETLTIRVPGESREICLKEGELIHMESSYKFSQRETLNMFDYAGLRVVQKWSDKTDRYDIWLVEKATFHFSNSNRVGSTAATSGKLDREDVEGEDYDTIIDDGWGGSNLLEQAQRAHTLGLPKVSDWKLMWDAWNCVTLTMIPHELLHEKPIDLRHICLFYLGHIPAFIDIHISNHLSSPHTNPHFSAIFERGIDPHMDDITQCNPHSEVPTRPEDWPKLDEILEYQRKVQERVEKIYTDVASGEIVMTRRLARMLWMTLEHINLHLETLLYMLIQSPKVQAPAGFSIPDWSTLSRGWDAEYQSFGSEKMLEQRITFDAGHISVGHDDFESQDFDVVVSKPSLDVDDMNQQLGQPEFGWDNEHPRRIVETEAFQISALPVSNAEYLHFLESSGSDEVPASWTKSREGDYLVRTFYGPVSMHIAKHWPCQASGRQLALYASSKGGRLPTHAELRRLFDAPPEVLILDLNSPPFDEREKTIEQAAAEPLSAQQPPARGSAAKYVPREEQSEEDLKWMQEALTMAQEALDANEVPVGGVFVRKGEVIARGRNRTNELLNATRHAELEAIDYILSILPPSSENFALDPHSCPSGDNPFKDTTLYVTIEPCIMCGAALRQIGIGRVVFGAGNERFGGNGSVIGLHDDEAILSSPAYESVGGYMRDEAIMMLRRFYITENANAPNPQSKAKRVLKTEIQPPGMSMHKAEEGTQANAKTNGRSKPASNGARRASVNPTQADVAPSANVGFRNWHPVPASLPRYDSDGTLLPGHNGGVWEWTSTSFAEFEGFEPSKLYPGYSSDFFDNKHSVVLGGSFATAPAVAGRRTFVNYYQTSYPYIFGGARVVWPVQV